MIKFTEFSKIYGFEPKITFSDFLRYLPPLSDMRIRDSDLYKMIKTLSVKAFPSEESEYDKRWINFYLPLKRRGYFILAPLSIMLYNKKFFVSFPSASVEWEIDKGRTNNDISRNFYRDLIGQVLALCPILKKNPDIVSMTLPYDIRTGKVLGKYVLEKLIPSSKKEKIVKLYRDHLQKAITTVDISLDDYLDTAALCYRACFGRKTGGLSAEQMYKKWADGRDCGMLEIRDRKSNKSFALWLDHKSHCGGHPFEIVFSMIDHGIHLLPPGLERPYFTLRVSNYAYAMRFLDMVIALIRKQVPFRAHELKGVLDYLSGESYFSVNTYSQHFIYYNFEYKNLLKHIKWDNPAVVAWK